MQKLVGLPDDLKWKMFFAGQAKNTKYLHDGDVVEASIATDDGKIDLGTQRGNGQVVMNDNPGFVPVVIVGAGPTGITAATKLAQYGVDCLVLDRWEDVYPRVPFIWTTKSTGYWPDWALRMSSRRSPGPRAGLQLQDRNMRVMASFTDCAGSANGFPQANMFDQPELETLPGEPEASSRRLRGNAEVTEAVQIGADECRSRSPIGPRGKSTWWRRDICSAATGRTAWSAPRSAHAWRT